MVCRCLLGAGMFFTKGANAVVRNIEERIARVTHLPVENGEGMQVLKYHHGQQYAPHHVSFPPHPRAHACRHAYRGGMSACLTVFPIRHSDASNCATWQWGSKMLQCMQAHTRVVFGIEAWEICLQPHTYPQLRALCDQPHAHLMGFLVDRAGFFF